MFGQTELTKLIVLIKGLVTNHAQSDSHMTNAEKSKLAGLTNYIHPSSTAYANGLYKITTNNLGHVTLASPVTKTDITNLGIPASDTHVTVDSSLSSTSINPVQNKIINSALSGKLETTGTAVKATADASGNTITSSYASSITVSDEGKMQLKSKSGTVLSEASVSVDDGITQELIDQSWDEIIGVPGVLQSSYVFDTTAPSTKTKNMVFIKNNTGGTS